MQPPRSEPVRVVIVLGGDHPTLAGGDGLGRGEAEDRQVAEGAHQPPLVLRAEGVRRIFDDHQVVAAGQLEKLIHRAGRAGEVHGHESAGAFGDFSLHLGGVHREGVGPDVHQHGPPFVHRRDRGR